MKRLLVFGLILFTSLSASIYARFPFQIDPMAFGSLSLDVPKVLGMEESLPPQKNAIRFTGDIMLARDVEQKIKTFGPSYPFSQLPQNPQDTYLVGNFEAAIPQTHVHTPNLAFDLSVDQNNVPALAQYGFNYLGLSNNHSYDFGREGYLNTVAVLKNASTTPFGDPQHNGSSSIPVLIIGTSTRVALVPLFAVSSIPSQETVTSLLAQANAISDIQIVFVHWGEEYRLQHTQQQETLAHELIDAGADAIVGHHPHVVEDIGMYKDKLIFYSLGNFIFDQYFSDDVMNGLMVEMSLSGKNLLFKLLPVSTIGSRTAPHVMAASERSAFLNTLSQKSVASLSKMIASGEIEAPQLP